MRLRPLDSLRGLAALVILLQNALLLIPSFAYACKAAWPHNLPIRTEIIAHSPLHLFWAGQEAIIAFFVLSGMSLLKQAENGCSAGNFLLNRFLRIYIPYACSLGLGIAVMWLLRHVPAGSLRAPWIGPLTLNITDADLPRALIRALLLLDAPDAIGLNPAIVPIIHLLRLMLLYPLLIWCLERLPNLILLITLVISITAHVEIRQHPGWGSIEISLLNTVTYSFFLTLGAWIGLRLNELRPLFRHLKSWQYWILISVATALLDARWEISPKIGAWPVGIGVGLIILLAMEWPSFSRFLTMPISTFFGRISFSLYLTHFLTLLASAKILMKTDLTWQVIPVCLAASLVIAVIFHVMVEKPSHGLSRRIPRGEGEIPYADELEPEDADDRPVSSHFIGTSSMAAIKTSGV